MDKDQKDQFDFLLQQLWCSRMQVRILDEINVKLHEMKEIAEYVLKYEPTSNEIEELNGRFNVLKEEVYSLHQHLYSGVH